MGFEALDEKHGLGEGGLLFCLPDLTMYRNQEVASCKTLGNSSDSVSLSGYLPHQEHEEMKQVVACTWSSGRTRILVPSALYTSKAFFLDLIFLCPEKIKGRIQAGPVHDHTLSFPSSSLEAQRITLKLLTRKRA